MTAIPMQKNGRLGRGLASLIGDATPSAPKLPPEGEHRVVGIEKVSSSSINPRKEFKAEELKELADSITQKGLVQPIIVRFKGDTESEYEIVAGERRWRAAQQAGFHTIPVVVRDLDDQEVLELAIIENVQRADLNAIEEANGYRDLIQKYNYTQDKVADVIGKSRSHLANTMRLLKLPEPVQSMVQDGRLSAGHARALVGRDDAEQLAQRIVDQNLNVRDIEALVQTLNDGGEGAPRKRTREKDADTRAFETEMSDVLGLKIEIKRGSGESGTLQIKYGNFDQLDYIRMRLLGAVGE